MIYITGDCHSEFSKLSTRNFKAQKDMTKDDVVIICGDFGGIWSVNGETSEEKYWLDWLNERNFTTVFVDGNHENFTRLYNYPQTQWHGGKVHKIRESVFHLMRGEIFDIENKKFFCFGGARSHDIKDGILNIDETDKIYQYRKRGAMFRVRDFSWWDLELPTKEEMDNAIKKLEKVNYNVDYVITHCCPTNIQALLGQGEFENDYLTDFLMNISTKLQFKKWFFGHYHMDKVLNAEYMCLYNSIIPLDTNAYK